MSAEPRERADTVSHGSQPNDSQTLRVSALPGTKPVGLVAETQDSTQEGVAMKATQLDPIASRVAFIGMVVAVNWAAPNGLVGFCVGLPASLIWIRDRRGDRMDAMWARHRARFAVAAAVSLYCLAVGLLVADEVKSGGWGFVLGVSWPFLTHWALRRLGIVRKDEL